MESLESGGGGGGSLLTGENLENLVWQKGISCLTRRKERLKKVLNYTKMYGIGGKLISFNS